MRAGYRAEDGDQHHQDRAGRQRVAEQRQRDILGQGFRHDAGADHGRDQQRRAERFGREAARQIEFGMQLRCSSGGSDSARPAERSTRLLLVRDAGVALAGAVAIGDAFACGQEGFPGNPGGIVDPGLLGFGVAAGGLALLDDIAARLAQARINFLQLVGVLDLNAEMIEAGLTAARRDRKIHPGIVEHPLGIIAS